MSVASSLMEARAACFLLLSCREPFTAASRPKIVSAARVAADIAFQARTQRRTWSRAALAAFAFAGSWIVLVHVSERLLGRALALAFIVVQVSAHTPMSP